MIGSSSKKSSIPSGLGKLRLYSLPDWWKEEGLRLPSLPARRREPGFHSNPETILALFCFWLFYNPSWSTGGHGLLSLTPNFRFGGGHRNIKGGNAAELASLGPEVTY